MVAPRTGRSQLSVGAGLDMKQLAETPRGSVPPTHRPGRERCGQREPALGAPKAEVCPGSAWVGRRGGGDVIASCRLC